MCPSILLIAFILFVSQRLMPILSLCPSNPNLDSFVLFLSLYPSLIYRNPAPSRSYRSNNTSASTSEGFFSRSAFGTADASSAPVARPERETRDIQRTERNENRDRGLYRSENREGRPQRSERTNVVSDDSFFNFRTGGGAKDAAPAAAPTRNTNKSNNNKSNNNQNNNNNAFFSRAAPAEAAAPASKDEWQETTNTAVARPRKQTRGVGKVQSQESTTFAAFGAHSDDEDDEEEEQQPAQSSAKAAVDTPEPVVAVPEPAAPSPAPLQEIPAPATADVSALTSKTDSISSFKTPKATWGAAAPVPAATNVLTLGSISTKPSNTEKKDKPAASKPNTQLQKATAGLLTTISLGQLKKSSTDIIPFPQVENGEKNLAAAIANSIAAGDYSLDDYLRTFESAYVAASSRYAKKNGLPDDTAAVDTVHLINRLVVQQLLAQNPEIAHAHNKTLVLPQGYLNLVPHALSQVSDEAQQKQQVVAYLQANGCAELAATDSSADTNDNTTVQQSSDQAIAAQILAGNNTPAQIKTVIEPFLAQIKPIFADSDSAVAWLSALFFALGDANATKDDLVALCDALFDANVLDYNTIDDWQTKAPSGAQKTNIVFKISGWISSKKPQMFATYDDEEQEEDDFGLGDL